MSGEKISAMSSAGTLTGSELIPVVRSGTNLTTTPTSLANFIETLSLVPSGVMLPFAGTPGSAPAGWLVCNGAAVSRTTYAALFAAIGTGYGSGDGSTTFNLPDLRARTVAGYDPGNATGRLTGGAGGVSASGYNAGGEQTHTLVTGELASHSHAVTDPGHTHTVSDPGHIHGTNDAGHNHSINDPGHGHNLGTTVLQSSGGILQSGSSLGSGGPDITLSNVTGISALSSTTGVTVASGNTGVTNNTHTTGVTTQNAGSDTGHNNVQPTIIATWIIKT